MHLINKICGKGVRLAMPLHSWHQISFVLRLPARLLLLMSGAWSELCALLLLQLQHAAQVKYTLLS